jgi:hypothetical protein
MTHVLVNYAILLYNEYIVQYVSLPNVKLQFLCTIYHNKHHILYIVMDEITQFISHMSWTIVTKKKESTIPLLLS